MKNLKCIFIIPLLLGLLLSGCSGYLSLPGVNSLSLVTAAVDLAYQYENGEEVNFVGNAQLNEAEIATVLAALDTVDKSRERLKKYRDTPLNITADMDLISIDYRQVKQAYIQVREIAIAHKLEYSPAEWQALTLFDYGAVELSKSFELFVEDMLHTEAISQTLILADTALKLAALL